MAGITFVARDDGTVEVFGLQGATWDFVIEVLDSSGVPFNLEGYSGRSQIRRSYSSNVVVAAFVVTVLAPTIQGKLRVTLGAATTATIKKGRYVFDVEIFTVDDANVLRILTAPLLRVSPEATK